MTATLRAQPETISPTETRLALLDNGYWPIPVKGKRPLLNGWSKIRADAALVSEWENSRADHTNTGILTGDVVAIDVDVLDVEVASRIADLIQALPDGENSLRRIGMAPKALYLFRALTPSEKVSTPEYLINGNKCQVEVLRAGQQFVAFGIHPDTQALYEWSPRSPLDVPLVDLPVLSEYDLTSFLAAASGILSEAGSPLKKSAPKTDRIAGGESFWQRVNSAALERPEAWVPTLFNGATREAGTGAWRVTSKELGRPLQEDISIHPSGIQDFGREQPETPINLAVEYAGIPTPKDAAFWLCSQLGVEPADLGWTLAPVGGVSMKFGSKKEPPEAANDDLQEDDSGAPAAPPGVHAGGMPEALCYPPGAVGDFVRFIVSCSRWPSPHLSLVSALALTAGLAGRRYKGPTGLRSNLYIIGLAESGFGKDVTIRTSAALSDSTSAGDKVSKLLFMDEIRSLPGLAGKLRKSPSAVVTIDEFGRFLAQHAGKNIAAHKEEIATALMALTGAPSGYWGGMEKAVGNIPRIIQPCFSIHGISTPSTFWNALSSGNISEGLLGRLVLVDAGGTEPKKVRRPPGSIDSIPDHLSETVNALLGGGGGKYGGGPFYALNAKSEEKPFPIMTVDYADGVEDMFEDFDDEIRSRKSKIDPAYRPILNRVGENAARLAMIVAIGCDPKNPIITAEVQRWANEVAEFSFYTMLRGADDNIADNDKSAEYLRVRTMIARKGKEGLTLRLITKAIRGAMDKRRLDDILGSLRTSHEIHFATLKTESGQNLARYWAAPCLPEGADILPME